MKLGLLTAPFAETPLADVAGWAHQAGFEALEIACWPKTSGATRRYAGKVADIADATGRDARALVSGILAIDTIFDPGLAANPAFRAAVTSALGELLSDDPMAAIRHSLEQDEIARLKRSKQSAL